MKKVYEDLIEFHHACEVPHLTAPTVLSEDRRILRARLIDEEREELRAAMAARDLPAIAQELVDLIYVTVGTALEYGIPLPDVWNEVHAANMRKVDPATGKVRRREDGKVLKPEGWIGPDVSAILTWHSERTKRPNIPGIMNERDRAWTIIHPDGSRVSFTDYNQEITGHTESAPRFPVLGPYIGYSKSAYYVVGEANRLGWTVIDHGVPR